MTHTVRALSTEELLASGLSTWSTVVVAIEDGTNQVLSYYGFDYSTRGNPCPTCDQRCFKTKLLWCLMERRGEGLFREIWDYTRATFDLGQNYSADSGPRADSELIWFRYPEIKGAENYRDMSYADAEAVAIQMMVQIQGGVDRCASA